MKFYDDKRSQIRPASMFSAEVYENSKGMTLSDDSLHAKPTYTRLEPRDHVKAGTRSQTLPAQGVSLAKKGRVYSQELLNMKYPVSEDLKKSLTSPVACVLVLGGKTRTQPADMGRSLDIWRCDIDPGMVPL